MKRFILSVVFLLVLVEGLDNYLSGTTYECVKCFCHARTGCYRRRNCASYSINRTYWSEAGELSVDPTDNLGDTPQMKYEKCVRDENCIVGTIIGYTNRFSQKDCNCDGTIDCKDRFAIHLFGERCENPNFGATFARRFNECARDIGLSPLNSQYSGCRNVNNEVEQIAAN